MIRQQPLKSKTCIWNKYTLGELCEEYGGIIQTGPFGSQLHQHDYVEKGTPVLMPKDIVDYQINLKSVARISDDNVQRLVRHKLNVGDLLLPRRGEVSKNVLISEKEAGFICGTGCLKITLPNVIFPRFFKYYLRTSYMIDWLESNAVGATMLNLSSAILYKLPVILPPYEIQQKIAAILSAYDDLIENDLKRIKLLEEMAQITYEEWFVRLKFPGHETTPMDSETALPVGWQEINLGSLIEHEIGGGWGEEEKSNEFSEPAFVIRGTDFDSLPTGDIKNVPYRFHKKSNLASRKLQDGDIVFEVSGGSQNEGVAKSLIITDELLGKFNADVICASFCKLARPMSKDKSYLLFHFLRFLRTTKGTEVFEIRSASNIVNYNWTAFLKFQQIRLPNQELIKKFNCLAEPIHRQIYQLGKQNQLLKEARDILLPRLMTGMIDVEQLVLPESLGELTSNLTQESQAA